MKRLVQKFALLLLVVACSSFALSASATSYVVCTSTSTAADSAWQPVLQALKQHHQAKVLVYSGAPFPRTLKHRLAALHPRYCCFVAPITELSADYVKAAWQLTRALDSDPYGDCIWGIVTGVTSQDALREIESPPLQVKKALLKSVGGWLDLLESGDYYSESDPAVYWYKRPGKALVKTTAGPEDDSSTLVSKLNTDTVDLVVTSGHASSYQWQLHYPTPAPEGFFRVEAGRLYGIDHSGKRFYVHSRNPKILYAAGNCLAGLLKDKNCLAAGWLHTGGAVQFGGYTQPTWFGYMGWGVADYFLQLQGRYTFTCKVCCNREAKLQKPVIWRLPRRILAPRAVKSDALAVEITDDLVLARCWQAGHKPLKPKQDFKVTFTAFCIPSKEADE